MAGIEETIGQLLGDPDSMGKIMELAQTLGLGSPPTDGDEASPLPPLDDRLPGLLSRLMADSQRIDPRQQALLTALKPFVRPERRASIDRALRIARITHLAETALRSFGKDGDGLV